MIHILTKASKYGDMNWDHVSPHRILKTLKDKAIYLT